VIGIGISGVGIEEAKTLYINSQMINKEKTIGKARLFLFPSSLFRSSSWCVYAPTRLIPIPPAHTRARCSCFLFWFFGFRHLLYLHKSTRIFT
jgi:hypothetical protein